MNAHIDTMIEKINRHATRYNSKISSKVIEALRQTPRHVFIQNLIEVKDLYLLNLYKDGPLQIGYGQTISQPFIVAYMTEMLDIDPSHKVLEIGTGSGYQATILSYMTDNVYTIERIPELAEKTRSILNKHIKTKISDGCNGWLEEAPFDRIMVTATADSPPQALIDQLIDGGKMIIPVKNPNGSENLVLITKKNNEWDSTKLMGVRFVPLIKE
jgi:protein-L-isoaspartate(D-aspartate) O-methyltransferase